ncbi:hypothetical protein KC340_g2027 [Hortaea werneckii]|nr:hypothetical protein KC342_g2444 [Hortaea werneckii]KAI7104655.1 hypothetical protein KC339_g4408 [Hortaea werneckii]KAI7335737.1 hypothetical protein KC340_g2027 [Hortaea werneckii]KAI7389671.1 hypothetical protein KC328_g8322 [Hortaea werneckii]
MKFAVSFTVALATCVAGDWLGKPGRIAYNKWHETELERWLSDHDIPYPTPADRKDLQDLVQKNWEDHVIKPYNKWDTNQLSNYLTSQGQQIKKGAEKNKDSLLSQVQSYWKVTEDKANDAYADTQSWIFDTWTESQLKAFLDYHGIPNPSPRTRDSLLHTARANYQNAANKAGETASYPGDWLYSQWSDSELKAWADERGIPVPQPSTRDKLVANVRRKSKIASDRAAEQYASLSKSAADAQHSLTDQLLESWSDTEIKEWCDKNGVKVPQGSRRNELIALARKHAASISGNNAASSASGAFGAATTSAGNTFAQATNDAYGQFRYYYDYLMNQFGMASTEAQSSLSSASSRASVSASSMSSVAEKSASSASKDASKSGHNAASAASSAAREASNSVKAEL